MATMSLVMETKNDTAVIREDTDILKQDTSRILEEIERLQDVILQRGEGEFVIDFNFTLRRYLERLSSCAESSRGSQASEDLWSQEGVPSRASLECQAEDSDAQAEPTGQSTDKNIAPTVESDPPGHWLYSFQLTNPQTPLVVEAHSAPAEYLEWALRQTVTRHNGLHTEFT